MSIAKWAKDPEEDNIEKLMNVYQVLSEEECNIALIYNRKVTECNIYLAVVNNGVEGDISEGRFVTICLDGYMGVSSTETISPRVAVTRILAQGKHIVFDFKDEKGLLSGTASYRNGNAGKACVDFADR